MHVIRGTSFIKRETKEDIKSTHAIRAGAISGMNQTPRAGVKYRSPDAKHPFCFVINENPCTMSIGRQNRTAPIIP